MYSFSLNKQTSYSYCKHSPEHFLVGTQNISKKEDSVENIRTEQVYSLR